VYPLPLPAIALLISAADAAALLDPYAAIVAPHWFQLAEGTPPAIPAVVQFAARLVLMMLLQGCCAVKRVETKRDIHNIVNTTQLLKYLITSPSNLHKSLRQL
jgi:hypothetical protein